MKDAFGGIVNLVFIVVFLLLVSGVLGLTVNYTKAFRVKNIAITAIENYEGKGCFSNSNSRCIEKVRLNAERYGYSPTNLNCPSDYKKIENLFCVKGERTNGGNCVYTVITQVDIDIPIINKITEFSIFQVHGDTRSIYHISEDCLR